MVNRISAEIIADSLNDFGNRLTTYVLTFPRIVLAEFNTHRMISKNSASSRAIPFNTMVQKVLDEPFVPIAWQKEHKGMQGTEYFDSVGSNILEDVWLTGRDAAVKSATDLHDGINTVKGDITVNEKVTKQLCNRILEPYLYHTVICTGSEWENFFALRAHPDAEIHIADLAEKMLKAYNESKPKQLKAGEWHIPFGDTFDLIRLNQMVGDAVCSREEFHEQCAAALADLKVKIATARCARISYLNFEGKDDYNADIKLHDILHKSGHYSPFEHCAYASNNSDYSGNFRGWIQYRKTLFNENRKDPRVQKFVLMENI